MYIRSPLVAAILGAKALTYISKFSFLFELKRLLLCVDHATVSVSCLYCLAVCCHFWSLQTFRHKIHFSGNKISEVSKTISVVSEIG